MLASTLAGHGAGRLQQYESQRRKPPAMVNGRQIKETSPKGMVRNQYGPAQNCVARPVRRGHRRRWGCPPRTRRRYAYRWARRSERGATRRSCAARPRRPGRRWARSARVCSASRTTGPKRGCETSAKGVASRANSPTILVQASPYLILSMLVRLTERKKLLRLRAMGRL